MQFSEVLDNADGPLFQGTPNAVTKAFSYALNKVKDAHAIDIQRRFNIKLEDIHLYSYRKCAHTRLNCGTTDGPSGAAACIRGGHSLGTVRNVYIQQEKASDYYCGRILSGLPVNDARFAISFPDFIPIDVDASCRGGGISEEQYQERKDKVDEEVTEALASIFGRERLESFLTIDKFLRVGLASHLLHLEKIEKLLPPDAKIRQTALFTNPRVAALKEHIRVAMPWEGHYKYFKIEATGLPAHVALLYGQEAIKKLIADIPATINAALEERQMNGPVSLAEMRDVVTESDRLKNMERTLVELAGAIKSQGASPSQEVETNIAPRFNLFDHPDKIRRRIPAGWEFPKLKLQHMYVLWHCGNEAEKIAAIKFWDCTDVQKIKTKRSKAQLSEVRRVMKCVDDAAIAAGVPPQKAMTHAEVLTCYHAGKSGLPVPRETKTGRLRNLERMSWTTLVRNMPKVGKS